MPDPVGLLRELHHRGVPPRSWPTALARMAVLRAAPLVTPLIAVDWNEVRLILDTRDRVIAPWTFALGPFSAVVVERALSAMAAHGHGGIRDRTVLEVGANTGTETVSFIARHGAQSVIAIEPAPRNVELLRLNIAVNKLEDRVRVLPIALSDVDGTVTFELAAHNSGDHRVRVNGAEGTRDLAVEHERDVIDVPAQRLDTLVGEGLQLSDVALAWLDAQGHEGQILAGASALLDARIPVVTEYWPYGLRRAGGLEGFNALVAERGYQVLNLDRDRPSSIPADQLSSFADAQLSRNPLEASTDLLLLPR